MPSKSKKQARLMAAVAHNPKFAKKVGIPQSVGREFNDADRKLRKYADGGKVKVASRINKILAEDPRFSLHRWQNKEDVGGLNSAFYDEILRNERWDPDINRDDLGMMMDWSDGLYDYWQKDPAIIGRLDELIKKHGIRPRTFSTWRGLELDPERAANLRPGDKLKQDLPSSVSVSKDIADAFANQGALEGDRVPTLLRIAPNSRLALPLPFSRQSELLMPSGEAGKVFVDKIKRGKSDLQLDVEVLGPHPGFAEGGKVSQALDLIMEQNRLLQEMRPKIQGLLKGKAGTESEVLDVYVDSKKPSARGKRLVKVLKNPSPQDVLRFAGRDVQDLRLMADLEGNAYAWNGDEAIHDWVLNALKLNRKALSRPMGEKTVAPKDYEMWLNSDDDYYTEGFAEGGEVLPSSTDEDEDWTDTYLKRPLSGLASMWGGTDPETGEFVSPALHNLKRAWDADERRRQGLPPQRRASLGIVDETVSLPALGGIVGLPVPQFAEEAEERASTTRAAARESLGLDAPHGFKENIAESAGVMAGQLPVPASIANKLKLLKKSGKLGKAGKIFGPAAEWFSPTVVPKASNYIKGTLFGGVLGGGLDYLGDYMNEEEEKERHKQFISEAVAEVLEEERIRAAEESGDETTDDEALAELGYAEGGRVKQAKGTLRSLRRLLSQPEPEDIATRKAAIDNALRTITTPGAVELPKTIRAGLNEQRGAPAVQTLIDRALPLLKPARQMEGVDPKSLVLDVPAPPRIQPADDTARGLLTDEEYAEDLRKIGFAGGGAVGVKERNPLLPAPQSQKEEMANQPAQLSRTGTPLSQEWYENYGAGPEHLFLGDRKINLPEYWGPQRPGAVPPQQQQPQGSWLPAAGILGFAAYDEWKKRRGQGEDSSQAAFWQNMHDSASDTSDTDAWVNQQLDEYGSSAPMPVVNDDGTVSYVQPSKFWQDVHRGASNTADTDAWVNSQLGDYANEMAMPRVNDDGTVSYVDKDGNAVDPSSGGLDLGRAWQGLGGAYDVYGGLGRGDAQGYLQAYQGLSDMYGAYTGAAPSGGGTIGGLASVYGGIEQGGVAGYTQAAGGALQTANTLGLNTGALGAAAGKAIPLIGAAMSAYGAYESAKVGDKKGAVAQGAAAGAAVGSVIPVVGTAIGAVVGALVGLAGASLGDKQQASEAYYGAHKDLKPEEQIRGWSEDQVNGAVFETIKSHTKSGNINKFPDVGEMYTAFGITKDAHKNYKNVQGQMGDFINGVIETAQQMGSLPTDPMALRQLDGQQIYYKVIVPAVAAKYKEATGKDSTGWTVDKVTAGSNSKMHALFADWTDWTTSHWGESQAKAELKNSRVVNSGDTGLGMSRSGGGRRLERARGGRVTSFEDNPRSGALSVL